MLARRCERDERWPRGSDIPPGYAAPRRLTLRNAPAVRRLARMAPKIEFASAAPDQVRADLLAVPVFAASPLRRRKPAREVVGARGPARPGRRRRRRALGGTLLAFMAEAGFEGKRGEALAVPTGRQARGQGRRARRHGRSRQARRRRAPAGRRRARARARRRSRRSPPRCSTPRPTRSTAATPRRRSPKASRSARYQFLTYKSEAKPTKLARGAGPRTRQREGAARDWRAARGSREAVAWARDLVNEPAAGEVARDGREARRARSRARTASRCRCWRGEQLARERLGGVLGVGIGSERPPRFLRLAYEPRGAKATLALVGKGVVFDSGGLSLKTAGGMETMKTDMSGARGGDRGDVGAARPRREDARRSASCRSSRTCRAATRCGPATCSRCATARRSRCSTPTPRAG